MKEKMTLHEKLAYIQGKFKAKKSRFNSFGKYNFRSAEDILEALKPFVKELKVTFKIDEELGELEGLPMIKTIASISDGESHIKATAIVGVDLKQKGMQIPQQFGSASSYGKKYALGNLLLIDDTQDDDATNDGKNKTELKKVDDKILSRMSKAIKEGKYKTMEEINTILENQGYQPITKEKFNELK